MVGASDHSLRRMSDLKSEQNLDMV